MTHTHDDDDDDDDFSTLSDKWSLSACVYGSCAAQPQSDSIIYTRHVRADLTANLFV